MRRFILLFFLGNFGLFSFAFATNYFFFYGQGCPHCFEAMEYLQSKGYDEEYDIQKKEVYFDQENRELFASMQQQLGLDHVGVPLLVIQEQDNLKSIMGDRPIMDYFDNLHTKEEVVVGEDIVNNEIEHRELLLDSVGSSSDTTNKNTDSDDLQFINEKYNLTGTDQSISGKREIITSKMIEQNEKSGITSSFVENSLTGNHDILTGKEISWGGTSQWESTHEKGFETSFGQRIKFFLILVPAALSDSINPCAFAVILLLLTSILARYKNSKRVVYAGSLFTFAVFISYLLMGMGLYTALASTSHTFTLKLVVGILGILVGLANLKDVFWYGKGFIMEVPLSRRPKMKAIIAKTKSPLGAFVVGLVVSLFLLPCTSGPYITILGFLSSETHHLSTWGYIYLIIYNIIFVLPMLIITILVSLGVQKIEAIEQKRKQHLKTIHLIVGLLMMFLGLYLLNDIFGWILF